MATPPTQRRVSLEDYLQIDDEAECPGEYRDGVMVEIEASSREHRDLTEVLLLNLHQISVSLNEIYRNVWLA